MRLEVKKCPHGVWHPHDALVLEDGSVADDPEGSCPGGTLTVEGRTFGLSHNIAQYLRKLEDELAVSDGGEDRP